MGQARENPRQVLRVGHEPALAERFDGLALLFQALVELLVQAVEHVLLAHESSLSHVGKILVPFGSRGATLFVHLSSKPRPGLSRISPFKRNGLPNLADLWFSMLKCAGRPGSQGTV